MVLIYISLVFSLFLGLSNESISKSFKELKIGSSVEIEPKDPLDLYFLEEWEVYTSIYDTLIQYQVHEGFLPTIAEKWSFNKVDGIITFKIKKNLLFSDSSPLTSKDVAFTFKRIIALDSKKEQSISRCLDIPSMKITSPFLNHPLITTPDSLTLKLGPTKCSESLLKDISESSYGIVSQKSIDNKFKVIPGGPVSGAYYYEFKDNHFFLSPNLKNWRWIKTPSIDKIEIAKFDESKTEIAKSDFDVFRTASPSLFEEALKVGYKSQISLPIMVWYLAPVDIIKNKTPWKLILEDINANLDRNKIIPLQSNKFEYPADTFFPSDYNCDKVSKIKINSLNKNLRNKYTIELINHKNGESRSWLISLGNILKLMGYKVSILKETDSVKYSQLPSKNTLRLQAYRQFLGDGTLNTIMFSLRSLQSIPDPDKLIIKDLDHIENTNLDNLTTILSKICSNLYHFNHIPIAHRKIAYLSKDENYFELFRKENGNILFYNLVNLKTGASSDE